MLLFIMGAVLLQVQDIPEKVRTAFNKQFPNARSVAWERESGHEWEADFKISDTSYSASYLHDGSWLETAHEIEQEEIPEKIRQALTKLFPDYILEESEKLETSAGGGYEFELEYGDLEIEVIMDPDGKILKKVDGSDDDQ